MTRRRIRIPAVGLLFAITTATGAACGGDGDDGDLAEWCDEMTEIDEQQEFPSDDQWQVLVDTAPDPIAGDVEAAVAILEEDGEEAIGSPELEPHLDAVFGFRDDRCTAR